MKVYIVIKYIGYEDTRIEAVFDSEEKADDYVKANPVPKDGHEIYQVEDWEVK